MPRCRPTGRRIMRNGKCCEEALKIDPQYGNAWRNLGIVGGGSVNGTAYSSKQCYEEALKIDPQYGDAWHNLGFAGGGSVNGTAHSSKQCYMYEEA